MEPVKPSKMRKELRKRIKKRIDKKDFTNWNDFYEWEEVYNKLEKEEHVPSLVKAVEAIPEDPLFLHQLMDHPEKDVRMAALKKVRNVSDEFARKVLEKGVSDSEDEIRLETVKKIRDLVRYYRNPFLVKLLEKAAEDSSAKVSEAAKSALKQIEVYKPRWEKIEELKPLAIKLIEEARKAGIKEDMHIKFDDMIRELNTGNLSADGPVYMLGFRGFNQDIVGRRFESKGLVDIKPELAEDIAQYFKKLVELHSIPEYTKFYDRDTNSYQLYQKDYSTNSSISASLSGIAMALSELARKTGNKTAYDTLGEMIKLDKLQDYKREMIATDLMVAHLSNPTEESKAIINAMDENLRKEAEENAKSYLKREADEERQLEAMKKIRHLTKDELEQIKKFGDPAVEDFLNEYENGERSFNDLLTVLSNVESDMTTQVLEGLYDQLRTKELLNSKERTGTIEEQMKQRDKEELDNVVQLIVRALSGNRGAPNIKQIIGNILAKRLDTTALKQYSGDIGINPDAIDFFTAAGEKSIPIMKNILESDRDTDDKLAAIIVLARNGNKEALDYLYDYYNKTDNLFLKKGVINALEAHNDSRSIELIEDLLSKPNKTLDKSYITKVKELQGITWEAGPVTITEYTPNGEKKTVIGKKLFSTNDIKSSHAFAAYMLGDLALKGNADAEKALESISQKTDDEFANKIASTAVEKVKQIKYQKEHQEEIRKKRENAEVEDIASRLKRDVNWIDEFDMPKHVSDLFEKELNHSPALARNTHQWAVYGLGMYALEGNELAVEKLKTLGLKSPDRHTRELSKMILDHIEKKKKEK